MNNKRFHISNLSGLSKKIKEFDSFQFRVLFDLEKKVHELSFPESFSMHFMEYPLYSISMKLSGIKYNEGIEEYYYEWKILEREINYNN